MCYAIAQKVTPFSWQSRENNAQHELTSSCNFLVVKDDKASRDKYIYICYMYGIFISTQWINIINTCQELVYLCLGVVWVLYIISSNSIVKFLVLNTIYTSKISIKFINVYLLYICVVLPIYSTSKLLKMCARMHKYLHKIRQEL